MGESPEGLAQELPMELKTGLSEDVQNDMCDTEETPSPKTPEI